MVVRKTSEVIIRMYPTYVAVDVPTGQGTNESALLFADGQRLVTSGQDSPGARREALRILNRIRRGRLGLPFS